MDIDEYREFLKTLSDEELDEIEACEKCRVAMQESMDRRN